MSTVNIRKNWKSSSLSINSSSYARLSSFTKRCDGAACQKGFTKSKRSLPIQWGSLHIKPTFLPPTGIGTKFICKKCRKMSLKPIPATNELCCTRCGVLETLDGAYFDYEELHKCGDYKIVKPRRTNRKYNFRTFIENHRKNITTNGHTLSFETIEKANEIFERIEQHLPNRISMPFVAYQIFGNVVQSAEEKYVLHYFWLRVPQKAVAKHIGKWNEMLQQLQDE